MWRKINIFKKKQNKTVTQIVHKEHMKVEEIKEVKATIEKEKKKIEFSDLLIQRLQSLGNNKVSKFILKMREGLTDKQLKNSRNYPNYLDFDGNNITFINSSAIKRNNVDNPWDDNSRQSTPAVRIIRRILSNDYVNQSLTNTEIETFVDEWRASLDNSTTVKVLRGWDVLTAFNYKKNINEDKFGTSCANFNCPKNGYDEPLIKWFYFYIYNPEAISVVTVWNKGKLRARSVMFEGIQTKDSGEYKKGEHYKYLNLMYGEGDGKWKATLKQWGVENGCILNNQDLKTGRNMGGYIYVPVRTHYKTYPPVDSMWVNIEENIITNSSSDYYDRGQNAGWREAYKLLQDGGKHLAKNN